ncbi:MAG: hypothetical protein ACFFD6_03220 [Candidatus Thorarchaeota archaeon]
MQNLFEFLMYLWSLVGIPLVLVFIPGVFLEEVSRTLERPIRLGIRNDLKPEWEESATKLKLGGFGNDMHRRYRKNPQFWDRVINALFLSGHALILFSGLLMLGALGLFFFIIMDFFFLHTRLKQLSIEDRVKHVMDIEARTAIR